MRFEAFQIGLIPLTSLTVSGCFPDSLSDGADSGKQSRTVQVTRAKRIDGLNDGVETRFVIMTPALDGLLADQCSDASVATRRSSGHRVWTEHHSSGQSFDHELT